MLPEWMGQVVADVAAQLAESEDDYAELAELLVDVRELRRQLGDQEREVEGVLVAVLPDRKVEVPQVGVVERRSGSVRKKWDSEALVARLVRDRLYDSETGEARFVSARDAVDAAVSVVTACAPFTGSMGWRAGALRDFGIDPDEWCESVKGPDRIQIHGEAS